MVKFESETGEGADEKGENRLDQSIDKGILHCSAKILQLVQPCPVLHQITSEDDLAAGNVNALIRRCSDHPVKREY